MQRVGRVLSPEFIKASEAAAFIAMMMAKEAYVRRVRVPRAPKSTRRSASAPAPGQVQTPPTPQVAPAPSPPQLSPQRQLPMRPAGFEAPRPTGTMLQAPSAGAVAGPPPPAHPVLQQRVRDTNSAYVARPPKTQIDAGQYYKPQAPAEVAGQVQKPGLWGRVKAYYGGSKPQAPVKQTQAPVKQTQAPVKQTQAPSSDPTSGVRRTDTGKPLLPPPPLQAPPGAQPDAKPGLWDRVKWPLAAAGGMGALGVYGVGSGLASAAQAAGQVMSAPGAGYPGAYSTPLPARPSPYGY